MLYLLRSRRKYRRSFSIVSRDAHNQITTKWDGENDLYIGRMVLFIPILIGLYYGSKDPFVEIETNGELKLGLSLQEIGIGNPGQLIMN